MFEIGRRRFRVLIWRRPAVELAAKKMES